MQNDILQEQVEQEYAKGESYLTLGRNFLRLAVLFTGVLIPLFIFGSLAAQVRTHEFVRGDISGLRLVHRYATPERDSVIAFLTIVGTDLSIPVIAGMALILRFLNQSRGAIYFSLTVMGAWALNLLTKAVYQRARPDLWQSPTPRTDYSFPSGHAMVSIAIAVALIMLVWPTRLRWIALVIGSISVVVIGVSRLYLGVHYPSDVAAGWSAGLLWSTGTYFILRKGQITNIDSLPVWLRRN